MIMEHDPGIADALERFQPYLGPPLNNWTDVLRDSNKGRARPVPSRVSWRSLRIAAVAITCTLLLVLPFTAIAVTHWWFLPTPTPTSVPVPTPATGGPVEIAAGQWNGLPWTVDGFIAASRPQKVVSGTQTTEITLKPTVCVAMTVQGDTGAAGEGCGPIRDISGDTSGTGDGLITNINSSATGAFPAWVAGAVDPSVPRLAFLLADGSTQPIPLIDAPSSFDGAVKFFVVLKPQGAEASSLWTRTAIR